MLLFAGAVIGLYTFELADVPLLKVDEWWGAEASWTIWRDGRFALPGFAGHLNTAERTFFHPPGFYLLNAPVVGLLGLSSWSIRVLPTLCALLSFAVLYRLNCHLLHGRPQAWRDNAALFGVAVVAFNPMTFAVARHTRPETLIVLLACAVVYLLRDQLFDAEAARAEVGGRSWRRAFLGGLLSGYAVFSHPWAYLLPALIGLSLLRHRRLRLLAFYAAGVLILVGAATIRIGANYDDFVAETGWLRGAELGGSAWGYLQRRAHMLIDLFAQYRTQPVWLVEAVGCAVLALSRPSQTRRSIVVALVLVHAFLFVFPRQNQFYTVAFVYFWGAALPSALALDVKTSAPRWKAHGIGLTAARLQRLLCAALIIVEISGLGFWIQRDWKADYAKTLAPLARAMAAADPQRAGVVVGESIYYVALHQWPYLPRQNPSLWRLPVRPPATDGIAAEAILERWLDRGVRFVVLSSLVPEEEPLSHSALPASIDRRVAERIRATSTLLATSRTFFYAGLRHKYRWADIELWQLPAPDDDTESEDLP